DDAAYYHWMAQSVNALPGHRFGGHVPEHIAGTDGESSWQQRIVPPSDRVGLHETLEGKWVLTDECLRCFASAEDRHVATALEWADADDLTARYELIDERLVAWIHGHDLVHGCSRRFTEDDELHGSSKGACNAEL